MDNFGHALSRVNNELLAERINREMDKDRPKYKDFEGIYSDIEMAGDQRECEEYYKKKGINPRIEKSKLRDGILVEKMFLDAELEGLFLEEEIYDELITDDRDFLLSVLPAHEYDDLFNNVDLICFMRNEFTGHKIVPFAVDCTSNAMKVREKMEYRRTDEKVTGFTEVKYFKDTAFGTDVIPAGKLAKVPRFVVGCDAELVRDVLTSERNDWTKDELNREYEQIRYCLLKELAVQADGGELGTYFGRLLAHFEETRGDLKEECLKDSVLNAVLKVKMGEV